MYFFLREKQMCDRGCGRVLKGPKLGGFQPETERKHVRAVGLTSAWSSSEPRGCFGTPVYRSHGSETPGDSPQRRMCTPFCKHGVSSLTLPLKTTHKPDAQWSGFTDTGSRYLISVYLSLTRIFSSPPSPARKRSYLFCFVAE